MVVTYGVASPHNPHLSLNIPSGLINRRVDVYNFRSLIKSPGHCYNTDTEEASYGETYLVSEHMLEG